jgi:hypothetical protein
VAYANNDFGVIVGSYTDKDVVPHGFLRTPFGEIVSFDAPGAGLGTNLDQGTFAYSVNDLGVIAGEFQDPSYVYHAFIRYPDGSFKTYDVEGAGTASDKACAPFCGTDALDINLEGETAGFYVDGNNVYHGFVRSRDGAITTFDPMGSVFTFVCEETCLNVEGATTGYYADENGAYHGFIRDPDGTITTVDAPGSVSYTISASINVEGRTTGYFLGSDGAVHGYVRTRAGEYTQIDVPGAAVTGTGIFSINALGAVTGEFLDAKNEMHGFERFADGSFAKFDAMGAGMTAGEGTRPSTNNLQGEVTGWWVDKYGLNHGFVWVP